MRVIRRVVYMMKSRGPRTALRKTTTGSMQGREVVITFSHERSEKISRKSCNVCLFNFC